MQKAKHFSLVSLYLTMAPDCFLLFTHLIENIVCTKLLALGVDPFCEQFPVVGALVSGEQV